MNLAPKFDRSFWLFVALGIALRCIALTQPLVDAHAIRQCQTADATRSLIDEPGFNLSSRIPWAGDIDARYLQELPIYNYLVIGIYHLLGNLDASGKVTSILLWVAGFVVLQSLSRRILDRDQAIWANLLFVLAPLNVFYGQAFMPEMLIQLLAISFVVSILWYNEHPAADRWMLCAGLGLLGLLIKLPAIAHLYLILPFVVWQREKWKMLLRPRYWIGAIVTLMAVKLWTHYADSINVEYVPEWTTRGNLERFVGTLTNRFQLKPWLMVCFYLAGLVSPAPSLLAIGYGFLSLVRRFQDHAILVRWLVALIVYYLLWFGNAGPTGQSYYNFPALVPLCALFGIGMARLLGLRAFESWRPIAATIAIALVLGAAVPAYAHLFRQDRHLFDAAVWAKRNTPPGDIILFRPNHRGDVIDYPNNPVPGYYSERPTFIWTQSADERIKRAALERATWAMVTLPDGGREPAGALKFVNRIRAAPREPESVDWLQESGFMPFAQEPEFRAYKRAR